MHHGKGIKPKHVQRFVEILLETLRDYHLDQADEDRIISRINMQADAITGSTNVDG